MKDKIRYFFILFLLVSLYSDVTLSQQTLIDYWHLNNTLPANGKGGVPYSIIPANYTAGGPAFISYAKRSGTLLDTAYADNAPGDTINQRSGYGLCCGAINNALQLHNPADSMEFLWYIPTLNFKNITVTFETMGSSPTDAPRYQLYDYSTDSGLTFSTAGLYTAVDSIGLVWQKEQLLLGSDSLTNNNNRFIFRIRLLPNNTNLLGSSLFDNLTVEGDPICPGPAIVSQTAAQQVCEQGKINFSITTADTGLAYQWQISNGPAFSNLTNTTPYSGVTASTLTITNAQTALNGSQYRCAVTGICTSYSAPVTLTVNPLPPAPVISLSGGVLSSTMATTYQWYLNGSIIPGASQQQYIFGPTGTYVVTAGDSLGCTASSAPFNVTVTGIAQATDAPGIHLYPNPATGSMNLDIYQKYSSAVLITIYDITGVSLRKNEYELNGSGRQTFGIDLSHFPAGIYFCEVQTEAGVHTLRMLVGN
jgi:hypothetical protein